MSRPCGAAPAGEKMFAVYAVQTGYMRVEGHPAYLSGDVHRGKRLYRRKRRTARYGWACGSGRPRSDVHFQLVAGARHFGKWLRWSHCRIWHIKRPLGRPKLRATGRLLLANKRPLSDQLSTIFPISLGNAGPVVVGPRCLSRYRHRADLLKIRSSLSSSLRQHVSLGLFVEIIADEVDKRPHLRADQSLRPMQHPDFCRGLCRKPPAYEAA